MGTRREGSTAARSASRGIALILLALVPAYCSIDGLVTGETAAISRQAHSHGGAAGIVTAISYALFATALVVAAIGFFSASPKRRATLFKWAWNVTIVAAVLFFAGRIFWMVQ